MTPPDSSKTMLRPWADNDRSQVLDQLGSSFVTASDSTVAFRKIDPRMIMDPAIPTALKGILLLLLNYPTTWEHKHIVKQIMRGAWVKVKAARKYLNELIDAGYVHPVQYLDCDLKLVKRYKVTSLPLKPGPNDDPNPREFVRLYGLQTARAQRVGFSEHSKTNGYRCLHSKISYGEMLRESAAEIAEQTEVNRVTGLTAWKELQLTSLNANSSVPESRSQKGTTIRGRNGSEINLTQKTIPTLPGEGFFSFFNEELSSTAVLPVAAVSADLPVAPVTCGPAAPAKRKTAAPKTPAAPRVMPKPKIERIDFSSFALWSEDRRTAPTGADLDAFLTDYVTAYPAAVAAIEEAGNTGTVKWAEAMLANPLIGMVQELLGLDSWEYAPLRKWSRRLRKGTVSTDDVVLLWTSKRDGSPYVDKALALWGQRNYRALVPATHYATGVAIWPPDLSWVQLVQRMRRDATSRLLNALPLPHVPRNINPNDGACRTCNSVIHSVEERFVAWVAGDTHPRFFTTPDAPTYFLGLVQREPLLWAMALPSLQRGMTQEIYDQVALLTANVTIAEMQALADSALDAHAEIPGGLTQSMLRALHAESDEAQVQRALAARVLLPYLPEGSDVFVADALFDTENQRERASYVA